MGKKKTDYTIYYDCEKLFTDYPHLIDGLRNYFNSRLRPDGDCVLWTGSKNKKTYGRVECVLIPSKVKLITTAHQVSFYLTHGRNPLDNLEVCHNCGNALCIKHLREDTHKNNIADKVKHGTNQRNEKHPLTNLTMVQAMEIYALAHNTHLTNVQIGKQYGNLTKTTIRSIKIGKSWSDIQLPENANLLEEITQKIIRNRCPILHNSYITKEKRSAIRADTRSRKQIAEAYNITEQKVKTLRKGIGKRVAKTK